MKEKRKNRSLEGRKARVEALEKSWQASVIKDDVVSDIVFYALCKPKNKSPRALEINFQITKEKINVYLLINWRVVGGEIDDLGGNLLPLLLGKNDTGAFCYENIIENFHSYFKDVIFEEMGLDKETDYNWFEAEFFAEDLKKDYVVDCIERMKEEVHIKHNLIYFTTGDLDIFELVL